MQARLSMLVILFLILSSILTGCYDAMEIDDEVYALVVGVDKGINNKLILTIQYPTYKNNSGGSQGGSGGKQNPNVMEGANVHTIEASTILEGIDMYGMAISRRVSLLHTKLLVFSEEFAKEGVGDYLAPIARYRETRRSMLVGVVRGKAEDFIIENKSNIGDSLTKSIELINTQSKNTSFFPEVRFNDFYRGMLSPYESAIAEYVGVNDFNKISKEESPGESPFIIDKGLLPGDLPRNAVVKREYAGTAVFNGNKMVGSLDSYETRYYLLVIGKYNRGIITIDDKHKPGFAIPVDIRTGRSPQIKSHFENGKPVIDIKLKLEAEIGAIQSRINYEKLSMLKDLNSQISEHIKNGIEKTIKKTQKDFKADIFGFGHKVIGHFSTIQEWKQYNWLSHYPEAKVNVNVEVNVRRTGLMINSAPLIDSSGEKDIQEVK